MSIGKAVETLEVRRLLTTYYVDNGTGHNGSDSNAGTTLSAPFLTIQKAALLALPGDTVAIRGGTYRETVTPAHSGTASAPITFQPYNNEKVVVSGADVVNGGWTNYSGNIYQSSAMNWTMGAQNDQLFVDGQMVNFARWPNTSLDVSHPTWATAGPNTTGKQNADGSLSETIYDANLTQPAGYWNGATLHVETGYSGANWAVESVIVTSYTRAVVNGVSYGVISYTSGFRDTFWNIAAPGNNYFLTGDPYFTQGQFQTLDSAGEFYRDPNNGKLYLWTPGSDSPASHVIEAKHRAWAFDFSGDSYITLNGINIFAAGITSSSTSNHLLINNINAQHISHFLSYTDGWNPVLPDGTDANGNTGIVLNGNYDTIQNSVIAYSAGDGIYLGGNYITVYNNVVHDADYAGVICAGINEFQFVGATTSNDDIGYNSVYNCARSGISVSGLSASRVHHNKVWNPMLQTSDGAGIYGYYGNGNNTEIDHNIVFDVYHSIGNFGVVGIFLDTNSGGYTIDHNLIYNVWQGIDLFQTNTNNILNNTVVNAPGAGITIYGAPSGNVANNAVVGTISTSTWSGALSVTNNIQSPTDPLFVSSSTANFQLQSSSPAINTGLAVAPYTNGYVGSAPDIGAFEYGSPTWTAGATNTAAILATAALPTGWVSADIGAPLIAGGSTYNNGVFVVSGEGTDIWGASDQFQFVSTPVSGDQTLVARVTSQSLVSGWSKSGVMFRSSTAANSAFVTLVTTPANGINLLSRDASGNLKQIQVAAVANPVWLKLVRSGNNFTAYDSVDGVSWTTVGTMAVPLPAAGLMGLDVTSQTTNELCTSTFDNVMLQPLPAPTSVTATLVSSTTVSLNWNASLTASGYQIQRGTDGVNFSTIATVGNVTNYLDTNGVSTSAQYYYRILAVNALGSSVASATVAIIKPPSTPTSVTVATSPVGVTLSWVASPGAASYSLYRGATSGGEAATPIATGITATTYLDSQLITGSKYYYYVTASSPVANGLSYQSAPSTEVSTIAGVISVIPSVIQAANYDLGGEGVAYHDTDTINSGGAYRNDGVDVEGSGSAGYDIGFVSAGEWLNYTISVSTTGYYTFSPLVASPTGGGTLHFNIDGNNVTGALTVPNTGGWGNYSAVTSNAVQLTAGTHVMRLSFDTPTNDWVGNVKTITLAAAAAPTLPVPTGVKASSNSIGVTLSWNAIASATGYNIYRGTTSGGQSAAPVGSVSGASTYVDSQLLTGGAYYYYVTAITSGAGGLGYEGAASAEVSVAAGVIATVPGLIQAANYDLGGEGIAYHDKEQANLGGAYRTDGVDVEGNNANGYDVGWTWAGEWLNYTISVPSTGYYTFSPQVASPNGGGVFHLNIDSTNVSGPLTIPNTGGWQTYTTLTTAPVLMTAGTHVMRLAMDAPTTNDNVGNFKTITITAVASAPANLTATANIGSIALAWATSGNATSFNIYRGTTAGGESKVPLATGVTANRYTDTTAANGTTYYYFVTAVSANAESTASNEVSATVSLVKFSGTPIGTNISWNNNGDTIAQVFDGNLSTFFDAANSSLTTNWAGLDLGSSQTMTQIQYAPRAGNESRMIGGQFQVSSTPDFSGNVITLYTITNAPIAGQLTAVKVNANGAYRFIRYVGGTGWVNIAEMEVDGAYAPPATQPSASLVNSGFESAATVNPSNGYDQTIPGWTLAGRAGLYGTNAYLGWSSPAVDGSQAIALQGYSNTQPGSISQTFVSTAGTFNVSLLAAQRTALYSGPSPLQPLSVSIDGTLVGTISPTTGTFLTYTTPSFALTAGTHTLVIAATLVGNDQTTFVDDVAINVVAPTPVKLTGVTIGTSTSYLNKGDTIAQVFDGNFNSYFDAPNSSLSNWVGQDLLSPQQITTIKFAPRSGYEWRMVGGQFQASSTPDFSSNVQTLYTIGAAPVAGQFTTISVSPYSNFRYVRYVGGKSWVDIAEMEVDGIYTAPPVAAAKLTGTVIGTQSSYLNNGDTIAQVFDGNFNSYYDAPNNSLTNWVGLDLGTAKTITQIKYAPRAGNEWRMVGGQFQVSTTADFSSNVTTIYTVTTAPVAGQFTTVSVSVPSAFRYIRYVGGNGWVNIAEMEVDGLS